jgi:hypothetical protein
MHSQRLAEPPRLLRSVAVLAVSLCAIAVLAGLPWLSRQRAHEPQPVPKPVQPEKERRIRVVRIPKPQPVRTEAPKPAATPPPKQPPRAAPRPPPPRPAPQQMQAAEPKAPPHPIAQVAPDVKAVRGVTLHIFVPSSPDELADHLRNSGGCLVVSRLSGDDAGVLKVFGIQGSRAVETSESPCSGIPRKLNASLNAALGDPLGRVRAEMGGGDLALQVYLSPVLHQRAEYALVARFGAVSQEEMAQRAAESGYELSCRAEASGTVSCQ